MSRRHFFQSSSTDRSAVYVLNSNDESEDIILRGLLKMLVKPEYFQVEKWKRLDEPLYYFFQRDIDGNMDVDKCVSVYVKLN